MSKIEKNEGRNYKLEEIFLRDQDKYNQFGVYLPVKTNSNE